MRCRGPVCLHEARCHLRLHVLEELLHAVEEAALLGRVVGAVGAAETVLELAQQLLLILVELHRGLHHHLAQQVAGGAAAHRLDALAAQAEELAGLCLGRNLQFHPAIQGRHLQLATERGVDEVDRHLAVQVLAVALEDMVRLDVHLDVEIPRRAAVEPRLALAVQANAIAGVDARGNLHRQGAGLAHAALAVALVAGHLDVLAGAVAGRAGLLHGEEALLHAHLAVAGTGRAGLLAGARLGA